MSERNTEEGPGRSGKGTDQPAGKASIEIRREFGNEGTVYHRHT